MVVLTESSNTNRKSSSNEKQNIIMNKNGSWGKLIHFVKIEMFQFKGSKQTIAKHFTALLFYFFPWSINWACFASSCYTGSVVTSWLDDLHNAQLNVLLCKLIGIQIAYEKMD